jgi:glycosyltransferase involved in cell wall biosynthesis
MGHPDERCDYMTSLPQISPNRSIVHVVPRYPPGLGGVEKVAQYLARNQHKLGMRVQVLTSDEGENQLKQEEESFRISRLKSFNIAHTPVMPALLPRLFGLDRDSIIHLHSPSAYTSDMVWIYAHVKSHPYLAHFHGIPGPSGPAGFLLHAYKPLLRAVLHGAAAVAVLTEEYRSMVTERFGVDSTRVSVIPNGVDETFLYDGQRFLHAKPRLLFVGRLAIQKNLILLLRALNGISHQFETTLVGEGELETELKQAVGEMRLENVRFHGIADGAELRELYRSADVFVLPSEREGMPLVLLEALAMGLPIVATDIPGNRDLVVDGQNGLLVPPEDPVSLRRALLHVTADPNRYQYMSETSRRLADKYSWEAVCADFEQLYAQADRDRRW